MAPTITQLGLGLGAVVLILGIFLGGYHLGSEHREFTQMSTRWMLLQSAGEAAETYYLLKLIEEGRIEEAKGSLNLSLDSEILMIDTLRQLIKNGEGVSSATKLLAAIAHHRKRHPHTRSFNEVDKMISQILTDAADRVSARRQEGDHGPDQ